MRYVLMFVAAALLAIIVAFVGCQSTEAPLQPTVQPQVITNALNQPSYSVVHLTRDGKTTVAIIYPGLNPEEIRQLMYLGVSVDACVTAAK